eukprot:gene12625-15425_t
MPDRYEAGQTKVIQMASAQRGLWKLMLKLPALRGQLQMESAKNKALMGLCDAFDDATTALDQLNRDPRSNAELIKDGKYAVQGADLNAPASWIRQGFPPAPG